MRQGERARVNRPTGGGATPNCPASSSEASNAIVSARRTRPRSPASVGCAAEKARHRLGATGVSEILCKWPLSHTGTRPGKATEKMVQGGRPVPHRHRPALLRLRQYRIGDGRDERRGHLDRVELLQVPLDLARRHPARVESSARARTTARPGRPGELGVRAARAGATGRMRTARPPAAAATRRSLRDRGAGGSRQAVAWYRRLRARIPIADSAMAASQSHDDPGARLVYDVVHASFEPRVEHVEQVPHDPQRVEPGTAPQEEIAEIRYTVPSRAGIATTRTGPARGTCESATRPARPRTLWPENRWLRRARPSGRPPACWRTAPGSGE